MGERARAFIVIRCQAYEGRFHFYVERCIRAGDLKGWMRVIQKPMYDYIEMELEGSKYQMDKFIANLQKGPPDAKTSGLEISWKTHKAMYKGFQIRP